MPKFDVLFNYWEYLKTVLGSCCHHHTPKTNYFFSKYAKPYLAALLKTTAFNFIFCYIGNIAHCNVA